RRTKHCYSRNAHNRPHMHRARIIADQKATIFKELQTLEKVRLARKRLAPRNLRCKRLTKLCFDRSAHPSDSVAVFSKFQRYLHKAFFTPPLGRPDRARKDKNIFICRLRIHSVELRAALHAGPCRYRSKAKVHCPVFSELILPSLGADKGAPSFK